MEQTTISVEGMACNGCEANVTEALEALEGVTSVAADHEDDEVRIVHDDAHDESALSSVIEDAGYEVRS